MRRRAELALFLCGVFLLGSAGWKIAKYECFQSQAEWLSASGLPPNLLLASKSLVNPAKVLGRLEIPRLGMSVLIVDGDDEESLDLGAGHVPGTAPIGSSGNTVVAGHRDTAFRALRHIRIGDEIQISAGQTYNYAVESFHVVSADDTSQLQSTGVSKLTMVTCYPFRYIGSAPKRFIVRARSLSH
ncbi:MAG: class D sortase [Bryobacteraceae bacterium]